MKNIEAFRFIIVGGVNTVLTYILYIFLLPFFDYQIAYSVTFLIGIFLSYSLNTMLVFRKMWKWRKMLQYPLVYIAQYVIGLLMMSLLVGYFNFDEKIAPVLVVIIVLPITFFLSRLIINR